MVRAVSLQDVSRNAALRQRSPRVERLYALLQERMTQRQGTWGGDLTVLDEPGVAQLPLVLRRARSFEKTLQEMPIAIEDDDLIVGNTVLDGAIVRTALPRYVTDGERAEAGKSDSEIETGLSHKAPYYRDVLEKGLAGIIADIDRKLREVGARPPSVERDEKLSLFRAMRQECSAVITLAHRYAALADSLAATAVSPQRRDELLRVAQVCRWVPEHPARTFHEAVQSFWTVHYAFFSTQSLLSCGRLDQFLYPYLAADLEAGRLSIEDAQELVDCLWLRFNDRAQICRENFYDFAVARNRNLRGGNGPSGTSFTSGTVSGQTVPRRWRAGHRKRFFFAEDAADAINHWGQNLLLSGITPEGGDGTNEITYLCLNALEKFALTSPVVTVRLHAGSPEELVRRCAEVLKNGGGMPFINNDDVIVQAYVDLGVPIEDARDYANSNCWETLIQGKSDQELVRGINFLLYLELALNRGFSRMHGEQLGPDTGDPRRFGSFDDLMNAWRAQLDHQLKLAIDHIGSGVVNGTLEHSGHGKYCYNPLLSALVLDCIERERDVTRRGGRYTIWHLMGEAVANTIDAMAAIKKLVFEEKSISMDDLLDALDADWEGHEDLRRCIIARAPKFANDNDYADDIGREMMDYFVQRSRHHAARYPQVIFPCSVGTFSWYVMIGKEVAATPDGRRAGEPVAGNLSPVPGADLSGPTSAINSYVKMRVGDLATGAPLDLRLSKSSLKGEEGTTRLAALIRTFIDLGGNMVTFTVTDVEELKAAMVEPDKYRHLRVRMGGWTAYFVMLGEEQQRLHIKRVEHGLV